MENRKAEPREIVAELMTHEFRQVAARTAVSTFSQSGSGTQTEKDSFRVVRRAVTVAITKEGSICKISPLRLLITPEALCLHF